MKGILLSPPVVMLVYLGVVYGLYRVGGGWAAHGEDRPGKEEPYACGEDLRPGLVKLSYHSFFRLALMFSVLHLATLTVSTLPGTGSFQPVGLMYLAGIAVSVLVLIKEGEV
jgi:NADH:ubiquinone oxidoreductase subunit 3 (subunit A)